ncbi:MAG: 3-dehydroquinate synthase [Clostridia bacterium]|nr:3-dehydroquinate synthase [Clostridia bacterium]
MSLYMNLGKDSYDIIIERGALKKAGEYFELARKVLVVTDSGVPAEYAKTVASQAKEGYIVTFPRGEENKNFETYKTVLSALTEKGFTRTDCVVAVGGGVVGDLAGFAAASYMRGIDFYNIPTTVLSQIDSSIGGKTAIDFYGYKNIIGAFHQPKKVIIDADVTKTLTKRQIVSGLAEAVKMAATSDKELFSIFENCDYEEHFDEIIEKSLMIKKAVVEEDVEEKGLRKVLNFGHTVGHAIESNAGLGSLYHGECVALGMLYMADKEAKERILNVLKKLGLPTKAEFDKDKIINTIKHDKKATGDKITVIYVKEIGNFEMRKIDISELYGYINEV